MDRREAASIDLLETGRRAATLLHPLRLRLLAELRDPSSASGLARRLRLPRQKVNYHLRELEKEGLIEMVEERKKGNCLERVMKATARYYLISPAALGPLAADPNEIRDRFSSAYLVAIAARAIRDLAILRSGAEKAGKRLATFGLEAEIRFASAGVRNAFVEELANELVRLVAKYQDEKSPGGRRFRFFIGGHPVVSKPMASERKESRT